MFMWEAESQERTSCGESVVPVVPVGVELRFSSHFPGSSTRSHPFATQLGPVGLAIHTKSHLLDFDPRGFKSRLCQNTSEISCFFTRATAECPSLVQGG